jgi:hypothetical protein
MTDWIEHTTDTCPVDPETVVEVRYRGASIARRDEARFMGWHRGSITHYRIITPAKPPETEMETVSKAIELHQPPLRVQPEPDFIALRLECLKLAVAIEARELNYEKENVEWVADQCLHYVLNGWGNKA